jgi:hypothetical protein
MSKSFLALCLAGATSAFCPTVVLAQSDKGDLTVTESKWGDAINAATAAAKPAENPNNYDARALRLESSWGRTRILRGVDGLVIGTTGVFKAVNVEKIVAGSARAETEAKLFRASHRPGALATAIGAVTFTVGLVTATNNANSAATPMLMIAGAGGMFWGARQLNNAYASLSRAIWWYNRDLAR